MVISCRKTVLAVYLLMSHNIHIAGYNDDGFSALVFMVFKLQFKDLSQEYIYSFVQFFYISASSCDILIKQASCPPSWIISLSLVTSLSHTWEYPRWRSSSVEERIQHGNLPTYSFWISEWFTSFAEFITTFSILSVTLAPSSVLWS